ncbi:MAG TPA: GNAT family N-acetyltransferase [Ilumatobacteraceae bacterium]|nr:GNAT family N-acetyltransferase [Ilumatobacteraceae bacterium]
MERVTVREATADELAVVQAVNLAAFESIHESFADLLGPGINALVYPDWRESQQRELSELVAKPNSVLFVAVSNLEIVGFVVVELNFETQVGELCIIAVHPDSRRQGIGDALNDRAIQVMTESGMRLAELGTGGDQAHAAARRSYERVGYTALPLVRYYKEL